MSSLPPHSSIPPGRLLRDRRAKPRPPAGIFSTESALPWRDALRRHWPEYLIEAVFLAAVVVVAGLVAALVDVGDDAWRHTVPAAIARRLMGGLILGLAVTGLVYSPWGRRSGAHLNPAVTLAYFRLGKVGRADLVFYIAAQLAGAAFGALLARALLGPVDASTSSAGLSGAPGTGGDIALFLAEMAIAAVTMLAVLASSNHAAWYRWTGVFCGLLAAIFVMAVPPLSALGLGGARSLGASAPGADWLGPGLSLLAPVLGAQLAIDAYRALTGRTQVLCAKLSHNLEGRCIFCCQHPDQARALAREALRQRMPTRG